MNVRTQARSVRSWPTWRAMLLLALAVLSSACASDQSRKQVAAGTIVGAGLGVVGGPIGIVVGAGVGAATGALLPKGTLEQSGK